MGAIIIAFSIPSVITGGGFIAGFMLGIIGGAKALLQPKKKGRLKMAAKNALANLVIPTKAMRKDCLEDKQVKRFQFAVHRVNRMRSPQSTQQQTKQHYKLTTQRRTI